MAAENKSLRSITSRSPPLPSPSIPSRRKPVAWFSPAIAARAQAEPKWTPSHRVPPSRSPAWNSTSCKRDRDRCRGRRRTSDARFRRRSAGYNPEDSLSDTAMSRLPVRPWQTMTAMPECAARAMVILVKPQLRGRQDSASWVPLLERFLTRESSPQDLDFIEPPYRSTPIFLPGAGTWYIQKKCRGATERKAAVGASPSNRVARYASETPDQESR